MLIKIKETALFNEVKMETEVVKEVGKYNIVKIKETNLTTKRVKICYDIENKEDRQRVYKTFKVLKEAVEYVKTLE